MPTKIEDIRHELLTQDNRITKEPLFAVQQKRRIWGVDESYADGTAWVNEEGDHCEPGSKEAQELNTAHNDDCVPDGWNEVGYIDQWEFITACFTEKGARDFIDCNGHNLNEPRIYAYSAYRNAEFIAIRSHLIAVPAEPAAEVCGECKGGTIMMTLSTGHVNYYRCSHCNGTGKKGGA